MEPAAAVLPPLPDRDAKGIICLFDIDGTLTPARKTISPEFLQLLTKLRPHVALGTVGGSDFAKQQEQLGTADLPATTLFDFNFAENGLVAFRMGQPLPSTSFISWLGEEKYKKLVNWILRYIADLDIPVKRGTFVEFRNGMINISPIGRNANQAEREEFERYDKGAGIRQKMVQDIRAAFPDYGLTYSIGGQLSFDAFPTGWDKTFCLRHLEAEAKRPAPEGLKFDKIHFFGDKTFKGGNDNEIFEDERTIGHTVTDPEDTMRQLKELFPQWC